MQEITFSGSHREIGLQHGEALRERIRQVHETYLDLWRLPPTEIPGKVVQMQLAVRRYLPHLAEEISGIAQGAGVDEWRVYSINCRTELLSMSGIDGPLTECTAVGIASHAKMGNDVVLGQNWDWHNTFRGLTEVVRVFPKKGPSMEMLIEPGMVGKIGMNDAGVGVCLNYLPTLKSFPWGIPVHVMLRAILECNSYQKVYEKLNLLPRAASANYLVGDRQSKIGNFEATPARMHCIPCDRFVSHTNSYNGNGELCLRQKRFEDALWYCMEEDKDGRISPEGLKEAFRQTGVQFTAAEPGGIETVHTIIMNLTQGRLLVSDGAKSPAFKCYGWGVPATESAGPASNSPNSPD